MHTFETPAPIDVELDLVIGDARVIAGDRSDTIVDVAPGDPASAADVTAAEKTTVEFRDGTLVVKAPRQRGYLGIGSGKGASVRATVQVPAGSRVRGAVQEGGYDFEGLLGSCDLRTGSGDIALGQVGPARLKTDLGDVTVSRVAGDAEVSTGGGKLRIRAIEGTAVIKNLAGDSEIGDIAGDAKLRASAGDLVVRRTRAGLTAKTDAGRIMVDEVSQGKVSLTSGGGGLEVGIREGVAAWVDAQSETGSVRNLLDDSGKPAATARTVEVHARTQFGDIVVRRATADPLD
ncbi:DUF4097 family beta strand repeat-containing protein [Kitasatospora sp. NPDC087314]|uniref:DUF4097 family beta strand repeat-containing protein n=1 Tax=Kitasatospora sp. NPDC087314 TaxID=3364068 RepID=UPI003801A071